MSHVSPPAPAHRKHCRRRRCALQGPWGGTVEHLMPALQQALAGAGAAAAAAASGEPGA